MLERMALTVIAVYQRLLSLSGRQLVVFTPPVPLIPVMRFCNTAWDRAAG